MVGRKTIAGSAALMIAGALYAQGAFAQQETGSTQVAQVLDEEIQVEEGAEEAAEEAAGPVREVRARLVLTDPTVAEEDGSYVGISGDFWYISAKTDIDNAQADSLTQDPKGAIYGGAIKLGRGNFSAKLAFRTGEIDESGSVGGFSVPVRVTQNEDRTELELELRYLFRDAGWEHFVPYVKAGYMYTDLETDQRVTTPGFVFTASNDPLLRTEQEYHTIFAGVGAIMPVNEHFGFRADFAAGTGPGEFTIENGVGASANFSNEEDFVGMYSAHGMVYVNIFEGFGFEGGVKWHQLDSFDGNLDSGYIGTYAQIGYTVNF